MIRDSPFEPETSQTRAPDFPSWYGVSQPARRHLSTGDATPMGGEESWRRIGYCSEEGRFGLAPGAAFWTKASARGARLEADPASRPQ